MPWSQPFPGLHILNYCDLRQPPLRYKKEYEQISNTKNFSYTHFVIVFLLWTLARKILESETALNVLNKSAIFSNLYLKQTSKRRTSCLKLWEAFFTPFQYFYLIHVLSQPLSSKFRILYIEKILVHTMRFSENLLLFNEKYFNAFSKAVNQTCSVGLSNKKKPTFFFFSLLENIVASKIK